MRNKLLIALVAATTAAVTSAMGCSGTKATSGFDTPPPASSTTTEPDASVLPPEGDEDPGFGQNDSGVVAPPDARISLDAGCASARADVKVSPVYLHIVLDGSGSMSGVKWTAATGALKAFVDDLGAQTPTDESFGVGLFIFESTVKKSYTSWDVFLDSVHPAQAKALNERLSVGPSGGTPLLESMTGQLSKLRTLVPFPTLQPNGKLVLLVMTDGVPNGGDSAKASCITAAQGALQEATPITTFVVGVGEVGASGYDATFLGKLAKAGGAPAPGCDENNPAAKPCHFQITPGAKTAQQLKAELLTAINTIRGAAKSCEFELDKSGAPLDPSRINVVFTPGTGSEVLVSQNAQDGWRYDDPSNPTKVILTGPACETYKKDLRGKVQIVLGCKTDVK